MSKTPYKEFKESVVTLQHREFKPNVALIKESLATRYSAPEAEMTRPMTANEEALEDELTALRERVATLEAQRAEWERLANYARDNYTRRNAEALAEKARADAAEAATVEAIAEWIVKTYPGTFAGLEIRAGDWKKKT